MKTAHLSPKMVAVSDWMHITSEADVELWNKARTENICVSSICECILFILDFRVPSYVLRK